MWINFAGILQNFYYVKDMHVQYEEGLSLPWRVCITVLNSQTLDVVRKERFKTQQARDIRFTELSIELTKR